MPLMPASDPLKATLEREVAALKRELRALQGEVEAEDNPGLIPSRVIFSYPGTPIQNEESGAYLVADHQASIHRLDITALSAGSTDSILSVRVNGVERYAATLAGNSTMAVIDGLYVEVEEYDLITVMLTTVATGLASVVVNVHMLAIEGENL